MKCLYSKIDNRVMPKRYNESLARSLVATGAYGYCSKERWKSEVRDFVPEHQKNKKNKKNKKNNVKK